MLIHVVSQSVNFKFVGGGGQKIQSKKLWRTFLCMLHVRVAHCVYVWCTYYTTFMLSQSFIENSSVEFAICECWTTVETYWKSKTLTANSACTVKYQRCHVRTLLSCLSACATPEVCHVQCTEIVTDQFVCGAVTLPKTNSSILLRENSPVFWLCFCVSKANSPTLLTQTPLLHVLYMTKMFNCMVIGGHFAQKHTTV